MQELTQEGRVIGGLLGGGTVVSTKNGLTVRLGFKKRVLSRETVVSWQEVRSEDDLVDRVAPAIAGTLLRGRVGRAVSSGLTSALKFGHVVRLDWRDDEQSVISMPNKLFLVLEHLLSEQRLDAQTTSRAEEQIVEKSVAESVTEQVLTFATAYLPKKKVDAEPPNAIETSDEGLGKLQQIIGLRDQGVLSEEEFQQMKKRVLGL